MSSANVQVGRKNRFGDLLVSLLVWTPLSIFGNFSQISTAGGTSIVSLSASIKRTGLSARDSSTMSWHDGLWEPDCTVDGLGLSGGRVSSNDDDYGERGRAKLMAL